MANGGVAREGRLDDPVYPDDEREEGEGNGERELLLPESVTKPQTAAAVVPMNHGGATPSVVRDVVDPDGELTAQQRLFIDALLIDPTNQTAAAVTAGVERQNAASTARKWLSKTHIANALARAFNARSDRTKITQDATLMELYILMTSNIDNFELTDDGHVVVKEGVAEYALKAVKKVKRRVRTVYRIDPETNQEIKEVIHDAELELWDKTAALKLAMLHQGMLTMNRRNVDKDGNDVKPEPTTWVIGGQTLIIKQQ